MARARITRPASMVFWLCIAPPRRVRKVPSPWNSAQIPMTKTQTALGDKHGTFSRASWGRLVALLICGGVIGTIIAAVLYATKSPTIAVLPLGLLIVLGATLFKDPRAYWFAIALFSLQFKITLNVNDGLAVLNVLQIDYTIENFTFQIAATDLAFIVLILLWINDVLFHGACVRFPSVGWLAIGYLVICFLSSIKAPQPYLGYVELFQQSKFFIIFLYAANCLQEKKFLRLLAIVGVIILVTQGGVSLLRYETGYLTPFASGDTHQDLAQIEEYLGVDRSDSASGLRGFGTLGSPGSTVRLCMMVIPFGLFLCFPNPLFRNRLWFIVLTAFGALGLVFTFTRVYYITTAFQALLTFLILLRNHLLRREEVMAIVLIAIAATGVAAPKLYEQFTVREDSATVRLLQYETSAKMISDKPFLGVGLNNGTAEKRKYANVTYNKYDPETQFFNETTHNVYLNMASEIGVIGTACFVFFFGYVAWLAWRQSRAASDPEVRFAASAFFVVYCGTAVNSLMDPLQEYQAQLLLWLYAGMCLNLPRMAQPRLEKSSLKSTSSTLSS